MDDRKNTDTPDPDAPQTETRTLHQIGDRELWYAEGMDKSWSIPLWAEWRCDKVAEKHFALLTPCFTPYQSQLLILTALFQPHDVLGENGRWMIPRRMAEGILHKAPGVTPAYYYTWPDDNCPPLMPTFKIFKYQKAFVDQEKSLAGSEFEQHVSFKCGIPSSVVRTIVRTMGEEATKWMLENRRPIELGFCRLVALPFRSNWKEIVNFKCMEWKLPDLLTRRQDMWAKLRELGMPAIFCSPHNIGMDRGRLNYTLEVMSTTHFDKEVKLHESKKLSGGWSGYVAQYEETIEKLYADMVHALAVYVQKAQAPFAKISDGGASGIIRFLPVGWRKVDVRGVALSELPCHIIPPRSGFSVAAGQSDPRLVHAKAQPLPEMPALLPPADDVRKRLEQGDVVERGPSPANGVSVRHDEEVDVQREPVLPEPSPYDRDSPGMD